MINALIRPARLKQLIIATALVALVNCGGSSGISDSNNDDNSENTPEPESIRSFYMGFTPWLYEASTTAQDTTYTRLVNHGDMIKHHLLGGVPWQEALEQSAYHPNVEAEIQGRVARTPSSTEVFLAIDSLNTARDALAPYRGENDNMPLQGDWATRSWSSAEVIEAYINYSVDMINRFQPTHFEYGTEISELILNNPTAYSDYLEFAEAVYSSLKTTFPDIKIMVSVALKSPDSNDMQQIADNINDILPWTDVLGISVYPYAFYDHADKGDPAKLSVDWLSQVNDFAAGKPLAISETGWIAEDLEISAFGYAESSNPARQNAYLNMLLEEANAMEMEFVIWWTTTDFDTLWNNTLAQDPLAKIWKDIGFYDEEQMVRPALQTWNTWLERERDK